ncbi:MAG: glycoside hydrolase family 97 N-terminal domain-containing protein, partial [Gemmatimonadota bacterium]
MFWQVATVAWLAASQGPGAAAAPAVVATSPDGRNQIALTLRDGALHWAAARDGRAVVLPSRLGFAFRGAPALGDSLAVTAEQRAERDTTFAMPLGELARVRDHHREVRVTVTERGGLR